MPHPSLSTGDALPGCSILLPVALTGSGCGPGVLPALKEHPWGALSFSQGHCRAPGAPLGCPILLLLHLLLPFADAALGSLSLSQCWGQSLSTLTCPQGFLSSFLGHGDVPWGALWCLETSPQRLRGAIPSFHPLFSMSCLGGQGSSAGTVSALASRGAVPALLLRDSIRSPEPALLLLLAQDRRGGDTAGNTYPEGGSILPPPRSRISPTPSRWNPQCQDSASSSTRFPGAPFPRHVPLPAITRGTRCGCDPSGCHRAQFSWMSPQPAFPRDPSTLLPLPILISGITTGDASLS